MKFISSCWIIPREKNKGKHTYIQTNICMYVCLAIYMNINLYAILFSVYAHVEVFLAKQNKFTLGDKRLGSQDVTQNAWFNLTSWRSCYCFWFTGTTFAGNINIDSIKTFAALCKHYIQMNIYVSVYMYLPLNTQMNRRPPSCLTKLNY